MQKAIAMPLAERRRRREAMMTTLRASDIHAWRRHFLARLAAVDEASSALG